MNNETQKLYNFIGVLLDIGDKLLSCGAEVYRVEQTLTKMAEAYGSVKRSVFVITSNIVISMDMPGGVYATDTRRIKKSAGTDFSCLERINSISRNYCKNPFPTDELRNMIDDCIPHVKIRAFILGSMLAAGSFAVFFGGTLYDGLVSSFAAMFISFLQCKVKFIFHNNLQFNFILSFVMGIIVFSVSSFIPFLNADKIIIGDIMLLIPGVAMTNSIRDILVGDTISGVMRFVESLIWAVGLAFGVMLSILILGGVI